MTDHLCCALQEFVGMSLDAWRLDLVFIQSTLAAGISMNEFGYFLQKVLGSKWLEQYGVAAFYQAFLNDQLCRIASDENNGAGLLDSTCAIKSCTVFTGHADIGKNQVHPDA